MSALRDEARRFALLAAPRVHAAASEDDGARRALQALADEGLLAWTIPARDGGRRDERAGADTVCVQALCELRAGLAYGSGMLDVMFVEQGLGSFPVALGGAPELRASFLPDVAAGKQVAAFALTEDGAGSSLAEVAMRAEPVDGGWRLNGAKTFISNAGLAHAYSVLARTGGAPGDRDGLSMFHLPATARGVEVKRFEVMAPHPIGEVVLHDVVVPREHLLGAEGGGLELALATLGRFRTSVAAAATGFGRRARDESLRRLGAREQFGRRLSSFQGLRFDVAEMDCRLRAAELLVDEAARAVDAGEAATREVARAKLYATETASWVCDRGVQHFGGLGVKRGEVVERLFREVRALRIYEGTSEVQKLILAKELFRRARSD